MAKASVLVTCSECGREYRVEKNCYNRREADEFEDWVVMQSPHYCPECYRKMMSMKRQKDREDEFKKAQEKTSDMPTLEGSEKQVAWATVIRAKALDRCRPEFRIPMAKQRKSAKWWIENRNTVLDSNSAALLMISEDNGITMEDAGTNGELCRKWAEKSSLQPIDTQNEICYNGCVDWERKNYND